MLAGPLNVYDNALRRMLDPDLYNAGSMPLTALLLSPDHIVDLASHHKLRDVKDHEIRSPDYTRCQVHGSRTALISGGASFHTDPIHFGDPVTLGPVKFMVIAYGVHSALTDNSLLLGISELSSTGAVEAQRSSFSITAPSEGWFNLTRSA